MGLFIYIFFWMKLKTYMKYTYTYVRDWVANNMTWLSLALYSIAASAVPEFPGAE